MVLGLFKSKKQKKLDALKITATTQVSGRSANKKKADAARELARLTETPKEEKATKPRVARGQGNRVIAGNQNRGGGTTSTTSTKSTKSKVIKGTPGSSKGAMAAKAAAKARIAAGLNTVTGKKKGVKKKRKVTTWRDLE